MWIFEELRTLPTMRIVLYEMYFSLLLQIAGFVCLVRGEEVEVHRPDLIRARCANDTEPPYPVSGPSGSAAGPTALSTGSPFFPTIPVWTNTGTALPTANISVHDPLSFSTVSPIPTFFSSGLSGPISASSIAISFSTDKDGDKNHTNTWKHWSYHPWSTWPTAGPTVISSVTTAVSGGLGGSSGSQLSCSETLSAPFGNSTTISIGSTGGTFPTLPSSADPNSTTIVIVTSTVLTTGGSSGSIGDPIGASSTPLPPYGNSTVIGPVGPTGTGPIGTGPSILSTGSLLSFTTSALTANVTSTVNVTDTVSGTFTTTFTVPTIITSAIGPVTANSSANVTSLTTFTANSTGSVTIVSLTTLTTLETLTTLTTFTTSSISISILSSSVATTATASFFVPDPFRVEEDLDAIEYDAGRLELDELDDDEADIPYDEGRLLDDETELDIDEGLGPEE
ncbi:hypothetical protein MMC06_002535 [Schaereria dolodes]|nr:hypothetical protein [Schaereria dolodes]